MSETLTPDQVRDRILHVARTDGRYDPAGFFFVNEVVATAVKWLQSGEMKPHDVAASRNDADGPSFHISGYELLEAFRRLARERWGMMAVTVLASWGLLRTEDVGEIVFLMVNDEELEWRRRDSDTKAEFSGVYDFREVFDVWGE